MRVLFYSTIYPRPWNVTRGIYCFHACRALVRLGHEVRVVSPRSWLERPGQARTLEGLSAIPCEYPTFVYPPGVLQSRSEHFLALSSRRAVARTVRALRPEAVLSYWAHPDGAVAAGIARQRNIPSAVIVGGSDVLVLAKQPGRRRRAVVRALEANDAILTVGQDLADAVARLGVSKAKIHVVPQGIDRSLFHAGDRSEARQRLAIATTGHVLVAVGSLLPIKGLDVLLDAMRSIDATLYLVGDGDARPALEAQHQRLGLGDRVRFVGKVDQAALPDWYRAADLTVLSSRSEGVPNVLRESLACGTPFVATRVGGTHEIAAGTDCPLVPPENSAALASAIRASLADKPSISGVDLLSWEDYSARIVTIFEHARASLR